MDKAEFSERVMAIQGRLYRVSYGLLREPQDRMDAVQEAILKAWHNLNRLRNEKFLETWLTRILINECHNVQRARQRLVPLEVVPEPIAPPEGANARLHDALMALPEHMRLPVMLYYMEGYKTREIAQILKLPEGTVKTRLKRARQELKNMLSEPEEVLK